MVEIPYPIAPSTFTRYQLDEVQTILGFRFNQLQIAVLRNLQATIAEEKLALEFDPEHPTKFLQNEAYKKGQLELLSYILQEIDSATSTTLE